MTTEDKILARLPYAPPFLFVDKIHTISRELVEGSFYLHPEMDFYKGHFKDFAITPGVILTEIMAQVSLVCLGLYLQEDTVEDQQFPFALTEANIQFYQPVYPGETVKVTGTKKYFRFGKLKCSAIMINAAGIVVCEGTLAGMQIKKDYGTT